MSISDFANTKPYQSSLREITTKIRTLVPAGQNQHGSAQWLLQKGMRILGGRIETTIEAFEKFISFNEGERNNEEGNPALVETEVMESFKTMNQYEKYVYLLQIYWTKYDFEGRFGRWITISSFYNILASVANAEKGQRIIKDEYDPSCRFFSEGAAFFHHKRQNMRIL